MNSLLNELLPALAPLFDQAIGLVLTAVLLWMTKVLRDRFGIEVEARHREALHSAIMSGVRASVARGLSGQDAIEDVLHHVLRSTPDAVSKLKPEAGVLENIIEGTLLEVRDGIPFFGTLLETAEAAPSAGGAA